MLVRLLFIYIMFSSANALAIGSEDPVTKFTNKAWLEIINKTSIRQRYQSTPEGQARLDRINEEYRKAADPQITYGELARRANLPAETPMTAGFWNGAKRACTWLPRFIAGSIAEHNRQAREHSRQEIKEADNCKDMIVELLKESEGRPATVQYEAGSSTSS